MEDPIYAISNYTHFKYKDINEMTSKWMDKDTPS